MNEIELKDLSHRSDEGAAILIEEDKQDEEKESQISTVIE